jgi:hypothetical protein
MPIRWITPAQAAAEIVAAGVLPAMGSAVATLELSEAMRDAMETGVPVHDPPLEPRDEAVYLLHTAAEIEHALLVQYLYAAYSLKTPEEIEPADRRRAEHQQAVADWRREILAIAKEEMGHLLTVQNLLLLLGAPLNFEREALPFKSEFYPFHFELEPLSRASVAKYVLAEMPANPDPAVLPAKEVARLRELVGLQQDGDVVNRVGALYGRIASLLGSAALTDADFLASATGIAAYQGPRSLWQRQAGLPHALDILVPAITDRATALAAIHAIATQGEAGTVMADAEPSHFRRFLAIYRALPKESATAWTPARALPRNPNTLVDPPYRLRQGNIGHAQTRDWAILFNTHYRLLLHYLGHYLHMPATPSPNCPEGLQRDFLRTGTLRVMRHAMPLLAEQLAQRPRRDNADAVAGPPFELPATLSLPVRGPDRWRQALYLHDLKDRLIERMLQEDTGSAALLEPLKLPESDRAQVQAWVDGANPAPEIVPVPAAFPPPPPANVGWPRIKQILDGVMQRWQARTGREPDLVGIHGASFGWETKAQLATAKALGLRLIDPAQVGNQQGAQTNLVIALRDPGGVAGNGQMPDGGPFAPVAEINEIIAWIDAGMPD